MYQGSPYAPLLNGTPLITKIYKFHVSFTGDSLCAMSSHVPTMGPRPQTSQEAYNPKEGDGKSIPMKSGHHHSKECSAHPPSSIFFTYHRRGSFQATSLTVGCRLEWDQVLPRLPTSPNPPHIPSGYGPTRSTSTQPCLSGHNFPTTSWTPTKF